MLRLFISMILILIPVIAHAQTKTYTYCMYDYLANCSKYSITSAAGKKCMADVGAKLSIKCINALLDEGYVTKDYIITRAKEQGYRVDSVNGEIQLVKETVTTPKEPEKPVVVAKETPKKTTVVEKVKTTVSKAKAAVKKAAVAVKTSITKAKTKVAVKKTPKAPVVYANRPNIKEQNAIRAQERDIVAEGMDADYGRYRFNHPVGRQGPKKNWKQNIMEGGLQSSGINGY
jgi:uncharacterized protein YdaT